MSLQLLFNQAVTHHQAGRLLEAEKLYVQVVGAGKNFRAQYLLAFVLYQQQRPADALLAVREALKQSSNAAEALTLQGILLLTQGQKEQALTSLTKATARNPQDVDAWYNRGVVLAEIKRFDEAVKSFDKALAIRPSVDAWTNRGAALLSVGRHESALQSFDSALAISPGFEKALFNRGVVLMEMKRFAEAIAVFDTVLTQAPGSVQALNNRGVALQEQERYAEAVESYDKILAAQPDFVAAWSNRARTFQITRQFDEAFANFNKAISLRADHALDWIGRSEVLQHFKRFDEALADMDKALALAPKNAEVWRARATALQGLSRLEEALACVDKALALAPEHLTALPVRGWLLCELGRINDGIAVLQRNSELIAKAPAAAKTADSEHKQRHDAEQRAYLTTQGVQLDSRQHHVVSGERLVGGAINPANVESATEAWMTSRPQIVVIDNLLTDEALGKLRRFCWGSTVWQKSYKDGYLGALPEHGFVCPLLAQVAEELHSTFPAIMGEHGLRMLWGFKYDSTLRGIRIHADQAAVNVNFWITPDEGNLDPDGGGLVIWDASAPQEWDFDKYNGDEPAVRAFLKEAGAKPVKVPYRANRAVIFDSDLFHETDTIAFKEGYLNRRINITMLYGRRNLYGV